MTACDLLLTNAIVLTMDAAVHRPSPRRRRHHRRLDRRRRSGRADAYRQPKRSTAAAASSCRGWSTRTPTSPMTLLRGLADDLRLDVWLMGYMMPVEREFVSPDFVRLGTRLGCAEMIRSGVTCFADMYYFEDAIAEATAAAGMRALCAQTVLRFPDARRDELRGLAGARARVHPAVARPSADRAGARAARAVHLHAGDPARLRRARGRIRRAAPHPPVGNGAGSGRLAARSRHAGRAVGEEAAASSTRRCWPRTASTWTTARFAR